LQGFSVDGRLGAERLPNPAFRDPERRRWEEIFPDHTTVTLIGAGHYIQEDAADEIITAIRAWSETERR